LFFFSKQATAPEIRKKLDKADQSRKSREKVMSQVVSDRSMGSAEDVELKVQLVQLFDGMAEKFKAAGLPKISTRQWSESSKLVDSLKRWTASSANSFMKVFFDLLHKKF
jgi:hypothetical protein